MGMNTVHLFEARSRALRADLLDTGLYRQDADGYITCDRCSDSEPSASERHDHARTEAVQS